jgi:two-component system sensor histidine kinase VicK
MTELNKTFSIESIRDIGRIATNGICVYDFTRSGFLYFNDAFTAILNSSRDALEKATCNVIEPLVADDVEYVEQNLQELRTNSKLQDIEFRLRSEGGYKFVNVDAFLLDENNYLVVFIKDVTAAKQHFDYIVEFGARKDALLDMIAHNLSGPLNLTNNLLDAIDVSNKNLQSNRISEYSRLIRESTHQCVEIINSFLKEEHSESARVFVKNSLFDVVAKVKIVVERMKQFHTDKQFKIVSKHKELMVSADDVKFFQIVHNLLSNSVKFTPSKGTITVIINDYEHFFEVVVEDTGIGIPEFLQPHLFQRNTPASREGLKGEKSVGMGLYIISKLVTMMAGSISFESEENKGSTFLVRFPKE